MRQPTPDPYAWHRRALEGQEVRWLEQPQAGWFKASLVKGGPPVAIRIWMTQFTDEQGELTEDEQFYCEADGSYRDAWDVWAFSRLTPITLLEFTWMMSVAQWTREHRPDDPKANPRQPVNWLTITP